MRCLSVASSFHLLLGSVGEGNAEHSDNESVIGFGLYECLNECMPLLYHLACFIFGNVHTIEVGIAVKTFDFLNLELEPSVSAVLGIVVAICL